MPAAFDGNSNENSNENSSRINNTSTSSSSSSSLPTVVQWYTHQPALLASRTDPPPPYALLTYQAVATTELVASLTTNHNANDTDKPSLRQKSKLQSGIFTAPPPDLGIWNCRINIQDSNSNSTNNETLLKHILSSPPAGFLWTVDLSPPWASMETTLTTLQNALIRYLVDISTATTTTTTTTTSTSTSTSSSSFSAATTSVNPNALTSLAALRVAQFGLADMDESYAAPTVPTGDEQDDNIKVALMIVVRLDTTATDAGNRDNKNNNSSNSNSNNNTESKDDDYETQQHKALLLYHLRKYAVALQATLVFTTTNASTTFTGWDGHGSKSSALALDTLAASDDGYHHQQQQPPLTKAQLAVLIRAWAADGAPIWQDTHGYLEDLIASPTDEGQQQQQQQQHFQWVYGPGAYQQELLETVLLRAAQYPGHWDATKDSLWKIFPSNSNNSSNNSSNHQSTTNTPITDTSSAWLAELRQSVAEATVTEKFNTPEPKKKTNSATDTPAKTPNEAAAFFESLLK